MKVIKAHLRSNGASSVTIQFGWWFWKKTVEFRSNHHPPFLFSSSWWRAPTPFLFSSSWWRAPIDGVYSSDVDKIGGLCHHKMCMIELGEE